MFVLCASHFLTTVSSLSLCLSFHPLHILTSVHLILNLSSGCSTGSGSCTWSVSTAVSRAVGEKGWRWWGMSQTLTPSTARDSWPRSGSTSAGRVHLDCVAVLRNDTNDALKLLILVICKLSLILELSSLCHYDNWLCSIFDLSLHCEALRSIDPLQVSLLTSNKTSFQHSNTHSTV